MQVELTEEEIKYIYDKFQEGIFIDILFNINSLLLDRYNKGKEEARKDIYDRYLQFLTDDGYSNPNKEEMRLIIFNPN